jgi:hypothetical protein
MEPVTLVTTTVGVLTQAALALKGAKSLLDKYGDDALRVGKTIFELVRKHFEENEETEGEIEYFAKNPEQEKRQQAIADSLAALVEQNEAFRQELEKLVTEYQQTVPAKAVEETTTSVKVEVKIGGDVRDSEVYTAGRDITIGGR